MTRREVRLHSRLRRPDVSKDALAAFALDVMGRIGLEGEVGIKLCGLRTMVEFNRKYRGKSGPTDVLAFPDGGADESGSVYLGDILIALPVAEAAARERGHSLDLELKRLLLHGLLHLAGHDHETDGGRMARKERTLRKVWGLP